MSTAYLDGQRCNHFIGGRLYVIWTGFVQALLQDQNGPLDTNSGLGWEN